MDQKRLSNKFLILLITGFLVMVSIAQVRAQPVEQLTINYIEALTVPDRYANQVRVYVIVTTDGGKPIAGLSAANFDILEDGRKVAIDAVSLATDPMAVVLAVDTSGSMQATDKSGQTSMAAAKKAAVNFVSMLAKEDQTALFSFNNEPMLKMDFSNDHQAAVDAVNLLAARPNAATCLYDTAFDAVKKAAEIPRGRRAVILLTDGKDEKAGNTCSMHNANDVIDIATTKSIRVPIYTIGVGPNVDARELGRISSFTGGRSLMATSLSDLQEFYQIIAHQLKNQYLVTYTSRTPSGEHSLVLKVEHEGSRGQDEKRFWSPPLPVSHPPGITFISPGTTDKVKGTVTVKIRIKPVETVGKVRFYLDGSLKKEFTTAPFETFQWDTTGLSGGLHILRVEAVDINGLTGTAETTVTVAAPPITPATPAKLAGSEPQTSKSGLIWI
ncbi:MAG: VWA domain-containing protein, partial [Proteobacteria bacterium]|nr:VWA domain-containing protein [Pseudomonadota bacterium]